MQAAKKPYVYAMRFLRGDTIKKNLDKIRYQRDNQKPYINSKRNRQHNGQTKKTNNDLQNITQKTKDRSTPTPLKAGVNRKEKQFRLHLWHLSCYSCYKPGNISWMRKEPFCDYDKRELSFSSLIDWLIDWCLTPNIAVFQQPIIKEIMIGTTSSGVSDQVRAMYSICRFGATGILLHINGWKVHYGKI